MSCKTRRNVFLILLLCWLFLIFLFSSQQGAQSSELSNNVADLLVGGATSGFNVNLFVRKAAHLCEYTILGFILCGCYTQINSKIKRFSICLFTGAIFAAVDEIHQIFVPGRDGNIKDIFIDSFGIIIGVTIFLLLKVIKNKLKSKSLLKK